MLTNCKNCGAPLVNGKCAYCKTEYHNSENVTLHVNTEFMERDAEFLAKLTESLILTPNEFRKRYGLRGF